MYSEHPCCSITDAAASIGQQCRCCVKNLKHNDPNLYVVNYYQIGSETMKRELWQTWWKNLYSGSSWLKNFRYNISCNKEQIHNILVFLFQVHHQSSKFSTFHINQKFEIFLKSFATILKKKKINIGLSMTTFLYVLGEFKTGIYNFDWDKREAFFSQPSTKKKSNFLTKSSCFRFRHWRIMKKLQLKDW